MGIVLKTFTILISVILIVAAAGIALLAFPIFGNQALIVRSGSMEPNIGVGSVVVIRPGEEAAYAVGDVVSFKRDANTIITHRITSAVNTERGMTYTTKGDANEEADGWTVKQSEILGKHYLTVPEVGKALAFARSKYGFPLLIILPAAFVILVEFINIIREIRKTRRASRTSHLDAAGQTPPGYAITRDSFFTKKNFYVVQLFVPLIVFSMFFQTTSALFSDTETSPDNYFQAAATFGTPTPTPTPSITITPTPTGSTGNLCDDITVTESGNGSGSVNGVFIICRNHEVIFQTNETNVNTDVTVNQNTGNNTNNGNSGAGSSTNTGSTSTNINVNVSGGTNTNGTSQMPTPTQSVTPTP